MAHTRRPVALLASLGTVAVFAACGDANEPPTAGAAIPALAMVEGDTAAIDLSKHFTDPEGDVLSYAASTSGRVVSASVSRSKLALGALLPGQADVTATATDEGGLSATQSFAVTVERRNRSPTVADSIAAQGMVEGDTVAIDLSRHFADPEGDVLSYAASTSGGVVSVSVSGSELTLGALLPGQADVAATATDDGGLSATQSFAVTVEHQNRRPTLADSIAAQELDKGDTTAIDLDMHFEDPDEDQLAYTAESSNELLLTVAIAGAELSLEALRPGELTVSVAATDPEGLSASQEVSVTVVGVNEAPLVAEEIDDISFEQAEYTDFELGSYFSDPDGDPLTYAAVAADTTVVEVEIVGDSMTVSALAPEGTTVEVTATDPSGASVSQEVDATVDEGFSSDFTTLDTIRYWSESDGLRRSLDDDGLRIAADNVTCTEIWRDVRSSLSEWWDLDVTFGREHDDVAGFAMVGINSETVDGYRVLVGSGMRANGEDVNFRFDQKESTGSWSVVESEWSDELDSIGYGVHQVSMEYSSETDTLRAVVGDLELMAVDASDDDLPVTVNGETGVGICSLAGTGNPDLEVLVESAVLEGGHVDPES